MVFLVSRAEVGTKTHREGIFIVFRSLHFIIGILQGASTLRRNSYLRIIGKNNNEFIFIII